MYCTSAIFRKAVSLPTKPITSLHPVFPSLLSLFDTRAARKFKQSLARDFFLACFISNLEVESVKKGALWKIGLQKKALI